MSEHLHLSQDGGGVYRLTIARPQLRNALDAQAFGELIAACKKIAADPGARVLVLAGEGPAFSAGGDFDTLQKILDAGREVAQEVGVIDRDDGDAHTRLHDEFVDKRLLAYGVFFSHRSNQPDTNSAVTPITIAHDGVACDGAAAVASSTLPPTGLPAEGNSASGSQGRNVSGSGCGAPEPTPSPTATLFTMHRSTNAPSGALGA